MKNVSKIIFLSSFFLISFATQAHRPYPYPYPPQPHPGWCGYSHSSTCHTFSGNVCSMFVPNYHHSWFSGCITNGPLHFCLNLPGFIPPPVQNNCYLKGTPCTCAFGLYNGYYTYETGTVL